MGRPAGAAEAGALYLSLLCKCAVLFDGGIEVVAVFCCRKCRCRLSMVVPVVVGVELRVQRVAGEARLGEDAVAVARPLLEHAAL